jgi:hypothetical protein
MAAELDGLMDQPRPSEVMQDNLLTGFEVVAARVRPRIMRARESSAVQAS